MKVAFHIHEEQMWGTCLANVKNFLEMSQTDQDVEVVANGPAIKGYLNKEICEKIKEMNQTPQVIFSSCEKAMNNQGVTQQDFLATIMTVPSGVYYLVELQQRQYSYIKV